MPREDEERDAREGYSIAMAMAQSRFGVSPESEEVELDGPPGPSRGCRGRSLDSPLGFEEKEDEEDDEDDRVRCWFEAEVSGAARRAATLGPRRRKRGKAVEEGSWWAFKQRAAAAAAVSEVDETWGRHFAKGDLGDDDNSVKMPRDAAITQRLSAILGSLMGWEKPNGPSASQGHLHDSEESHRYSALHESTHRSRHQQLKCLQQFKESLNGEGNHPFDGMEDMTFEDPVRRSLPDPSRGFLRDYESPMDLYQKSLQASASRAPTPRRDEMASVLEEDTKHGVQRFNKMIMAATLGDDAWKSMKEESSVHQRGVMPWMKRKIAQQEGDAQSKQHISLSQGLNKHDSSASSLDPKSMLAELYQQAKEPGRSWDIQGIGMLRSEIAKRPSTGPGVWKQREKKEREDTGISNKLNVSKLMKGSDTPVTKELNHSSLPYEMPGGMNSCPRKSAQSMSLDNSGDDIMAAFLARNVLKGKEGKGALAAQNIEMTQGQSFEEQINDNADPEAWKTVKGKEEPTSLFGNVGCHKPEPSIHGTKCLLTTPHEYCLDPRAQDSRLASQNEPHVATCKNFLALLDAASIRVEDKQKSVAEKKQSECKDQEPPPPLRVMKKTGPQKLNIGAGHKKIEKATREITNGPKDAPTKNVVKEKPTKGIDCVDKNQISTAQSHSISKSRTEIAAPLAESVAKEVPVSLKIVKKKKGVVNHTYRDYSRISPEVAAQFKGLITEEQLKFPRIVHEILSKEEYRKCICWMPHGRAFRVTVPKDLENKVLDIYFGHRRYSTFLRHLNSHGFKYITKGIDRNCFYHEAFLRELPHLLAYMPKPKESRRLAHDPVNEPDLYRISELYPIPKDSFDTSASEANSSTGGERGTEEPETSNDGRATEAKPGSAQSGSITSQTQSVPGICHGAMLSINAAAAYEDYASAYWRQQQLGLSHQFMTSQQQNRALTLGMQLSLGQNGAPSLGTASSAMPTFLLSQNQNNSHLLAMSNGQLTSNAHGLNALVSPGSYLSEQQRRGQKGE